jgi:hypothetical protein
MPPGMEFWRRRLALSVQYRSLTQHHLGRLRQARLGRLR